VTWLLEEPLPILFCGVLALAILFAALVQTGKRVILLAMIALCLVCGGLLLLERLVVTPVEEVEAMLDQLASDVENNRHAAVADHISLEAGDVRGLAESRLDRVVVTSARIHANLEISVFGTQRQRAKAGFNGVAVGQDKQGVFGEFRYARYFLLQLQKEDDGKWRITEFEERDPF
jgi:hypothetical protein|tara:strand:- start:20 stop:547 length:528 start_codon:yes stop_codon:yes gene_type:complete